MHNMGPGCQTKDDWPSLNYRCFPEQRFPLGDHAATGAHLPSHLHSTYRRSPEQATRPHQASIKALCGGESELSRGASRKGDGHESACD